MKKKITIALLAIFMAVFTYDALTNVGHTSSSGAPAGYVGAPANPNTCATGTCHGGTAVTTQAGWITSNIPASGYIGGHVYTITATATKSGVVKFGFEIGCQNTIGAPLGTIVNTSTQTQIVGGSYITHSLTGTSGTNSKTWTFNWIAPVSGTGTVTFYGCFNCTNNDSHDTGDIIYTSTMSASEYNNSGLDAGAVAVTSPTLNVCTNSVTPTVKVKNFGTVAMTSCDVKYQVDNNAPATFSWTGSLAAGATTTATLPAQTVTPGVHTFMAYTANPNGTADTVSADDTAKSYFTVPGAGITFTEGFESGIFPPAGWSMVNPDNSYTWTPTATAHHTGGMSAMMDNYRYANASGAIDDLISPSIDLTSATSPMLSFYVAYAEYTANPPETLTVFISTDCGATYTSIYTKYGTATVTGTSLSTAAATTNEFVPTLAQWRKDSVSLSTYATATNAIFKFRNTNKFGNKLYLDDINITGVSGINEINTSITDFKVFPNPATDNISINYSLTQHENVSIKLYDIYGKQISTMLDKTQDQGTYAQQFEVKNLPAGLYLVYITAGQSTLTRKVMIN
ncbi:MAG: choice-of-anchor V domain-containing protein [Bacteroidota bacterium]